MNRDQVTGTVKKGAGKIQHAVGDMTGSNEHKAKGLKKEIEGTVQKKAGDIKESVKDAARKHH